MQQFNRVIRFSSKFQPYNLYIWTRGLGKSCFVSTDRGNLDNQKCGSVNWCFLGNDRRQGDLGDPLLTFSPFPLPLTARWTDLGIIVILQPGTRGEEDRFSRGPGHATPSHRPRG